MSDIEYQNATQLRVIAGRFGVSCMVKDGVANFYTEEKKLDDFVNLLKSSGAIPKEKLGLINRVAKKAGEEKIEGSPHPHKWAAHVYYDIPLEAFDMAALKAMESQRNSDNKAAASR